MSLKAHTGEMVIRPAQAEATLGHQTPCTNKTGNMLRS